MVRQRGRGLVLGVAYKAACPAFRDMALKVRH